MNLQNKIFSSIMIVGFVLLSGTTQAKQRLVYAWQEYSDKSGDENAMGYVYSQVDQLPAEELIKNAIYPHISSSGQLVAYSKKVKHGYEITVKNIITGKTETWSAPGFNLMASFSGNERYLAYSGPFGPDGVDRDGKPTKENRIAILDMWAAKAPSKNKDNFFLYPEIVPSEGKAYFPKLSSDGRYVVFHESLGTAPIGDSKKAQRKRVVMYDRHTKKSTYITPENGYCFEPSLSFDDRLIAAVCRTNENGSDNDDIYVFDRLNLSAQGVRVTTQPGLDYAPTFRPDMSIVFSSDQGQRKQEFRLFEVKRSATASYTAPSLLLDRPGVHYVPSFSGDLEMNSLAKTSQLVSARSSFGLAQSSDSMFVLGGNVGSQHDHSARAIIGSAERLLDGNWISYDALSKDVPVQGFELFYYNDQLFSVGGRVPDEIGEKTDKYSLSSIEVFDLKTNAWEASSRIELKMPRSSFVGSQIGSKIYLLYGWSAEAWMQGEYLKKGEVVDLADHTTRMFDLPEPYRRGFASAVWKNNIVLTGGFADGKLLPNASLFDPVTLTFKDLPEMPFGAFSPTAEVVGDTVFVFGGVFPYGKNFHTDALYVNHIYRLNLANPEEGWVHTGRYLKEPKAFLRAIRSRTGNQIHLIGGHSFEIGRETNLPVTTHEVWDFQ